MSTDPMPPAVPDVPDEPARPARPSTVDWAVYLIFARCLFSVIASILVFPYHNKLLERAHALNPKLSDAEVHRSVGSPGVGLFVGLVVVFVILVLAKFIRDGKNWARWTFAIISVLVFRDIFGITLLFVKDYPIPLGIMATLSGLSALGAIVLLFVRPSAAYFRKPGRAAAPSLFANLLRPRPRQAAPTDTVTNAPTEAAVEAPIAEPTQQTGQPAADAPARRGAPRPKSRGGTTE